MPIWKKNASCIRFSFNFLLLKSSVKIFSLGIWCTLLASVKLRHWSTSFHSPLHVPIRYRGETQCPSSITSHTDTARLHFPSYPKFTCDPWWSGGCHSGSGTLSIVAMVDEVEEIAIKLKRTLVCQIEKNRSVRTPMDPLTCVMHSMCQEQEE